MTRSTVIPVPRLRRWIKHSPHPSRPSRRQARNFMKDGQALPNWAREMISLYESNAASQFILHGNVNDRFLLTAADQTIRLGSLTDFFLRVLMPRFDVVLSYDLGNGIRVERGTETFAQWPYFEESQKDWRAPRPAIETLTRYFRYCANLTRLNQPSIQI